VKYLLDTDVVSQYTKKLPHPRVDAWMQRTDDREMYISEVTYAELWYGVAKLPAGKRRVDLESWIEDELYMQFFSRVVAVGLGVARRYGSLLARAEKKGFHPGVLDTMIAAIAVENGMAVATLNRKDFECLDVELVEF
jgi:predicted nucleic acid-binding protein